MSRPEPDEHGAAAVEMALMMPLLFLLLFGIVVFGLQLFRAQSMESAVREGGRLASIGADFTVVHTRILGEQKVVPTTVPTDLTIAVLRGGTAIASGQICTDATQGADVKVTASVADPAKYALTLPFIGDVAPDFVAEAVFRCE